MKKSIYAFVVLLAMSFTAMAQEEQKAPEVNNDPNAPVVTVLTISNFPIPEKAL